MRPAAGAPRSRPLARLGRRAPASRSACRPQPPPVSPAPPARRRSRGTMRTRASLPVRPHEGDDPTGAAAVDAREPNRVAHLAHCSGHRHRRHYGGHCNDSLAQEARARHPMTIRPRRSALYMPGSNARALEKARTLPADVVILDLEDSVAPDAKDAARKQVADDRRGRRLRRARGDRPHQRARHRLVARRPQRHRQVQPDAVLVPKVSHSGASGGRRRAAGRHQRRSQDPSLGDDGDAARHAQRRRDRRRRQGCRDPARGLRHGHQRSRQGHPRPHHARTRADAAVADELRRGGACLSASRSWTASTTISPTPTASRANARRPATWASTARR